MPSRGELRRIAEWALRGALLAVLLVALWRALHTADAGVSSASATTATLDAAVARAITVPVAALDVIADGVTPPPMLDALVALRRTGTTVRWHGSPPSLAMEAMRDRDPDSRTRIMTVGGERTPMVLSDSAGLLDTVRAGGATTTEVGTLVGAVRAWVGRYRATAFAPPPTARGAVLVLGRAGWEGKFVMSALTEAGWTVRASLPVAPNVDVRDDALLPLDTARYDAVIALDSSAAAFGPAIVRFVAQGGGLVAVGEATTMDALRGLVPARAGSRLPGRILLAEDTVTPKDLPIRPLEALRGDGVSIEKEQAGVALAARRAGMGRVLSMGYDETWRWRMLGGDSGMNAHRDWWSRVVGAVAPERESTVSQPDAAPRAALFDALGVPSNAPPTVQHATSDALPIVLLVLAAVSLLAEVASRRFRGER